jgi:hypothetical protein
MPVKVDREFAWPNMTMSHAVNGPKRFEYQIRYGPRTVVTITVQRDTVVCAQAVPFQNNGKIRKVDRTRASARVCARAADSPNQWFLLDIDYRAQTAAELRQLVMNGTRTIWMAAIDPTRALDGGCAISRGQRVDLDAEDFRWE